MPVGSARARPAQGIIGTTTAGSQPLGRRRILAMWYGGDSCYRMAHMSHMTQHLSEPIQGGRFRKHPTRFEWAVLLCAVICAFVLGSANLGTPSLWHDELFHVFIAKNIVEEGKPTLPSGRYSASAPLLSAILAGSSVIFGDNELGYRFPSVLFGCLNVVLTFLLVRALLGKPTALVAAWAVALSPWCVAWSREARLYTLQQTLYLVTMYTVWRLMTAETDKEHRGRVFLMGFSAVLTYCLGVLTSLHSTLFLAPIGTYAFFMLVYNTSRRPPQAGGLRWLLSRWTLACVIVAAAGLITLTAYRLLLPESDAGVIFQIAGIGISKLEGLRAVRLYYFKWLWQNLSLGFFILAMVGFILMLVREGRRGLFAALCFWAPVLVLTFLVSYRRPRFMFFVFPMYAAACSYGLLRLICFTPKARQSWLHGATALVIAVFLARLCFSVFLLVQDSVEAASGSHTTLARRHPQWRKPCLYVRDRLEPGVAVLSTTYLPVLYYVGRIDDWYPSRCISWEYWETGSKGLRNVEELKAFIAEHPHGFFIAEWWRFDADVFDELEEDRRWVRANMERLEEASSADVTVYAWGNAGD